MSITAIVTRDDKYRNRKGKVLFFFFFLRLHNFEALNFFLPLSKTLGRHKVSIASMK